MSRRAPATRYRSPVVAGTLTAPVALAELATAAPFANVQQLANVNSPPLEARRPK